MTTIQGKNAHNQSEIKPLNPYLSPVFKTSYDSVDKRLELLFEIKPKWLHGELQAMLSDFVEVTVPL
eukprot:CAMPEP_0116871230 /NCGR_PEP_ID=MMETSP0463-20121206/1482_1 /TAXON_ID=181622 /ORGANISM="Strombidinopsis sp, Strain SopsisLIS2011" /LENGTH=66 /DNA_ID=CAMNT_0004509247 /DNA_START=866 /DNA_END=1063 /DNA_ORIENTATION=+